MEWIVASGRLRQRPIEPRSVSIAIGRLRAARSRPLKADPTNYDANTRKGSDLSAQFSAAVANAIDDDYEYKLRLYDDGWGVPELRAAGAADGVMTQFLKAQVSHTPRGR